MNYADYSVLVVDDEVTNRTILFSTLEKEGYAVAQAENGKQALEMLGCELFDLVLLDIVMPEMDGIQVLESIKTSKVLRSVAVIMTTAAKEAGSVTQCVRLGAADYIAKPYDVATIRSRIWRFLSKDSSNKRPAGHSGNPGAKIKPAHILVVDSSTIGRDLCSARLASSGHTLTVADSVDAALQAIGEKVPDLIVLDVTAEGLDGFALIEKLKSSPGTRDLPVAVVTADDRPETAHKCIKLGTVDFIKKPFAAATLKQRIDNSITAYRQKRVAEMNA